MIHRVEPIDRGNPTPSTSTHHSLFLPPNGFRHKPTRKKLHPAHWHTEDHLARKYPSMPHCHRAGAPKSDKRPRPLQQMDQTAHRIAHSCCCPNREPPHCLATQVNAISPQQSARRSHSEDCIGHWCSPPSTRWCHRIVERGSGHHLQRSQQTTQTARCIALDCCCPNTPPSHQDRWRGRVASLRPRP